MFSGKLFFVDKETQNLSFFSIIIVLLSFPKIDPAFSYGIDFSLPFAVNYFFSHGIHFGKDVIFTYGPLSFLKLPVVMEDHLVLSIGFISVVYLTFAYATLYLGQLINKEKWLLHFGIVFFLSLILELDDLLMGTTAVSLLIHHEVRKWKWLVIALFSSMFGLYIKSSIGVVSHLFLFSYILIHYFQFRDIRKPVKIVTAIVGIYFLFWVTVYGELNGSLNFLWATFQLAKDNSAAVSLYPENNWWLLGVALVAFFLIPLVSTTKNSYILYGLFLLSLFASWKHSYSREEGAHMTVFYHFLILFFSVFIIFIDKIKPTHIVLMIVSLTALYSNMLFTTNYHRDESIHINGLDNFYKTFFQYDKLVEQSVAASNTNIQPRKLPKEVLDKIGNETVDVYPWDFSYIAANNLNWKPRKVLQSYAAYTEWLDQQDADYFSDGNGAQYVIWELTSDRYGKHGFCSIDNRYLLNDEPEAVLQFFNHYSPVYKNSEIILFKKTDVKNFQTPQIIKSDTVVWNEWIKVPAIEDGILRIKGKISRNSIGRIKAFVYKDEQSCIDYMLSDGTIVQYRIVPNSVERGVWINPLIIGGAHTNLIQTHQVVKIRFTCSNTDMMKERIFLEWEKILPKMEYILPPSSTRLSTYNGYFKNTFSYFMKYYKSTDTLLFHSLNDFENKHDYWSGDSLNICSEIFFRDRKSEMLNQNDTYSSTFTYPINTIMHDSSALNVHVSVWVKLSDFAKGTLVFSLANNNSEPFLWVPRRLDSYINDKSQWQQVFFTERLESIPSNSQLGIYIINENKEKIWIDDFDVKIYKEN